MVSCYTLPCSCLSRLATTSLITSLATMSCFHHCMLLSSHSASPWDKTRRPCCRQVIPLLLERRVGRALACCMLPLG